MPLRRRSRRLAATVLVVLASLLAFVAVLAIWTDRQILNTANWTESSTRVLATPVVRDRVADRLVEQLYADVDVPAELRAVLPERLAPLAEPAAGALRGFAGDKARDVLASPRAQAAWARASRAAQVGLIRAMEGGGPAVATTGGTVVLDLHELLTQLEASAGVGGRLAGRLPPDGAKITLVRSDQLETVQDTFKLLDALPVIAVVGSLALFGAALLVAPWRRRETVLGYGWGLVAAGAAALATASLLGGAVVDAVATTDAGEPAVREVWDIVTELLDEAATATIGYGAFLVLGAWLAGPSSWARAIRSAAAPYLREPAIAYGAFAVLAAIVVLWWSPTPATRNPLTAILLVLLSAGGLEGLRRRTRREFPDEPRPGAVPAPSRDGTATTPVA
jgi:hypothetical protein